MVEYSQPIVGTDVKIRMVPVAGGKFIMGSPRTEIDRYVDEGPLRGIEVAPFWIGKYEVTWGEYRPYMDMYDPFAEFERRAMRLVTKANAADAVTAPTMIYSPTYRYQYGRDPRLPAVSMSQFAARQYSKWLSLQSKQFYRLPTEAEWEYACRAGSTTAYSFGEADDDLAEYAVFGRDGGDRDGRGPEKVGTRKPNAWGIHDMHGNVSEWVIDEYARGYKSVPRRTYLSVAEAIVWPQKINPRVARGGGCFSPAVACRSAARLSSSLTWWEMDPMFPASPWWLCGDSETLTIGFRLIRPLAAAKEEQKRRFWDPDSEDLRLDVEATLEAGIARQGIVDEKLGNDLKRLNDGKNK